MMEEDRERKWGRTDGRGDNDQRGQNYDQSPRKSKKDSTIYCRQLFLASLSGSYSSNTGEEEKILGKQLLFDSPHAACGGGVYLDHSCLLNR